MPNKVAFPERRQTFRANTGVRVGSRQRARREFRSSAPGASPCWLCSGSHGVQSLPAEVGEVQGIALFCEDFRLARVAHPVKEVLVLVEGGDNPWHNSQLAGCVVCCKSFKEKLQ